MASAIAVGEMPFACPRPEVRLADPAGADDPDPRRCCFGHEWSFVMVRDAEIAAWSAPNPNMSFRACEKTQPLTPSPTREGEPSLREALSGAAGSGGSQRDPTIAAQFPIPSSRACEGSPAKPVPGCRAARIPPAAGDPSQARDDGGWSRAVTARLRQPAPIPAPPPPLFRSRPRPPRRGGSPAPPASAPGSTASALSPPSSPLRASCCCRRR